ncbi:hypothetical protein B0W48_17965 [Pseudoalteromonas aliena]|uniref:DUF4234 domain-containing protein n=1 Tax=Pseudoalteromonas aliena TaxID=247523 RepID=A0A1Q2H2C4_9GAMM|nr:hypothetical protein [Pseudoalteromonas aliena]AQQ01493.1 hypothetical protein B0W48_17965 [Pseudoalteromonas aliena]
MKRGFADIFKTDSVLKTLVLCVLTIGSYLIYKLYRFTSQINQHTEFKISNLFIAAAIVLFVISSGSLIYGLANYHDLTILKSSIGIHAISSAFDVTWIVMVRNRINLIAGSNKGDNLWLHPFVTSIFHVIYMQYKINQGLAKKVI